MNSTLFASNQVPSDRINEAGGRAYRMPPKQALAQLAATGCFNGVYYFTAETQLATLSSLINSVDDATFLAKLAIYSRERAFMKDMPAALLVALSKRDTVLFHRVFDRVVDNGRILRSLFQMVRSGLFGRNSLSYSLQRAINRWLNNASIMGLLSASIGNEPSLRDVLRAARPTPVDNSRRAILGWLTGRPVDKWAPAGSGDLPEEITALQAFRRATTDDEQILHLERHRFRWDLLAGTARGPAVWKAMARQMGTQALRMNLNTLRRHGVFEDQEMVAFVAERLGNKEEVRRSKQFPYQYLAAFLNADDGIPSTILQALEKAAECACGNVPEYPGPVLIGLDVSGSMASPVTGQRGAGSTSKMRCVQVAALFAAAIYRRNPGSVVVPFDTVAHETSILASESILHLADRLAAYGGGGTDCSLPLRAATSRLAGQAFAGCILISDCESWVGVGRASETATMTAWAEFVRQQSRLPGRTFQAPKLVCIDLQPYDTTQTPDRADILNIGGFSDAVFGVVAGFLEDNDQRFVSEIEAIEI